MKQKMPLTIGILSWGAHKTLNNTLNSYLNAGLLDHATQVFIFFQEISVKDQDVAHKFNLKFFGSETNLGIAGGYREMLKYAKQPNYLFLENDWQIHKDPNTSVYDSLHDAVEILTNHKANVVKLRSRVCPGEPLWTAKFKGKELSRPEHLLSCLHWTADPAKSFPKYIQKIAPSWYSASAQFANWTNNPHMIQTSWAKKVLLPRLGQRDIELDLQKWWQKSNHIVAQGEGLFTHQRL